LSDGAEGAEETSTPAVLRVSNCSIVTVTEVGCGPQLTGYRQHLIAWYAIAHNWAVHMHSPNVVPRTDFEGHTTSGVNNL